MGQAGYEEQFQVINDKFKLLLAPQSELESLISKEKDNDGNLHAFQKEIKNFFKLDISDEELLRNVLHKLIDRIEVSKDGDITIHYNLKTQY